MIGEWAAQHPYLVTLLYAMSFDVLLGLGRAWNDRALNSDVCGKGMRKKASMLILVLVPQVMERITGDTPIDNWLSVAFIGAELISILENAKLLGAPVPDWFSHYVETIGDQFRIGDSPRERLRILKQRKKEDPVDAIVNPEE